jgi:ATP-dependent helicase/nuclease subunit A
VTTARAGCSSSVIRSSPSTPFRGADVALYADTRHQIEGDQPTRLVTNFRSRPGIVSYVNELFSQLFLDQLGLIGERASRLISLPPEHPTTTLQSCSSPVRPRTAVCTLSAESLTPNEIAEVISLAVESEVAGSSMLPGRARFDSATSRSLTPTRTSASGVAAGTRAFTASTSRSRRRRSSTPLEEVRDAARDPAGDRRDRRRARRHSCPSVVVLRRCSDADLVSWRRAGGAWRFDAATPSGLVAAIRCRTRQARLRVLGQAIDMPRRLDVLVSMSDRRARHSPERRGSTKPGRVASTTRLPRRAGTRLCRVDGRDDRAVPRLRRTRGAWEGEVARADRLRPDEIDAVRIMTIHAAKGLEFPSSSSPTSAGTSQREGPRYSKARPDSSSP